LRTVLIVDEAQGLSHELLEEVRLLLNFETYTEKQLQIVLTGQPELRQVLNSPELRQLKQRISLRCEIKPLKADEVAAYIRTRLKVAGANRLDLFTADAVALLYRASEGIPRLINNLCDNALLTGYALNARTIGADVVGMSTVPEVIVGVHGKMRCLGLSVVTDLCLPDSLQPVSLPEIIHTANEAEPKLRELVKRVIAAM
jgi:hypothetical protein